MGHGARFAAVTLALAVVAAGCGGSSDSELTGLQNGSGGTQTKDASSSGGADSSASGGTGGTAEKDADPVDAPITTGGAAGAAQGGTAGASTGGSAGAPPIVDSGPDGNNPIACPAQMPAPGSPCNVLVNNADCVYGFKHCVCTVTSWLCVP